MIHDDHIQMLRAAVQDAEENFADAERRRDSARRLLTFAESQSAASQRARVSLAQLVQTGDQAAPGAVPELPGGAFGNPYPGAGGTAIMPPAVSDSDGPAPFDSLPDLERHRVAALERFTGEHATVCGDESGPERTDRCVLPKGHGGAHRDDRRTWPQTGGDA